MKSEINISKQLHINIIIITDLLNISI